MLITITFSAANRDSTPGVVVVVVGGGGGYSEYFLTHRLNPSICTVPSKNIWSEGVPPKNIGYFMHTQKIFEILA